jgi:hypothetical protein
VFDFVDGTPYLMPLGVTQTVNISKSDYLYSEMLKPPFRLDYFAYTNDSNAFLNFWLLEEQQFIKFQSAGGTVLYVKGLSADSLPVFSVRGK